MLQGTEFFVVLNVYCTADYEQASRKLQLHPQMKKNPERVKTASQSLFGSLIVEHGVISHQKIIYQNQQSVAMSAEGHKNDFCIPLL